MFLDLQFFQQHFIDFRLLFRILLPTFGYTYMKLVVEFVNISNNNMTSAD